MWDSPKQNRQKRCPSVDGIFLPQAAQLLNVTFGAMQKWRETKTVGGERGRKGAKVQEIKGSLSNRFPFLSPFFYLKVKYERLDEQFNEATMKVRFPCGAQGRRPACSSRRNGTEVAVRAGGP